MSFIRYILIQILAYGIDMGSFQAALRFTAISPVCANVLAKLAAGLFAFLVHRHYTFQGADTGSAHQQALKYFTLLGINIPIASGLLALLLQWLPSPTVAKFISDVICIAITYAISKRFVFLKATH